MRCGLVLGLVALIFVSACGKGNPGSPSSGGSVGGGTTGSNLMSAQIDGSTWNAVSATANLTQTFVGPIFSVGGGDASGRTIGFAFSPTGTGTYTTNLNPATNFILTVSGQGFSSAQGVTGSSGTITLTTYTSNRAIGTFSFVAVAASGDAVGSKTVTNGKFDLPF